jgi:hypothetical protein
LGLLEKAVKPPSNLVVDGALEDEVLLCLGFMKMGELADPVPFGDAMVGLNSKMMRTNPKLLKLDSKSMHLVPKCVWGLTNKAFSQLQEVLCIEGHLGA